MLPLQSLIDPLESAIGDPRNGLPEDVFLFVSRIIPMVNVDLLIKDEQGRILLTWRDDEHFGAGWHIPGGMIRYKETAASRIQACALDEIGTRVDFEPAPIMVAESISANRSRGHFISLLYRCRLLAPPDQKMRASEGTPRRGDWKWHDRCPSDLLPVQNQYARFF